MISQDIFEECVRRSSLAPSVHNTQPARWVRDGEVLSLFCDTDVGLRIGDPTGRDAGLSCGAALEAMVLALSAHGFAADVTLTGQDTPPGRGLVPVAHLDLAEGPVDGLQSQLEERFTWRGAFIDEVVQLFGWTRKDTRLVMDQAGRGWIADRNDVASHRIMSDRTFRSELVSWMRLSPRHPRAGLDGMDRGAMGMSPLQAAFVPFVLRRAWGLLSAVGASKGLTSEKNVTLTAPVIALFHRDKMENPVESGRAYLRLCLEASSLGFAGWPMAALSDDPRIHDEVCARFGIGPDRRLVQAIRFGRPTGAAPPRARRPLREVIR